MILIPLLRRKLLRKERLLKLPRKPRLLAIVVTLRIHLSINSPLTI
jgi:hypothetical protein